MKLTQTQINKLKKELELKERDESLTETIKEITKEYEKLTIAITSYLFALSKDLKTHDIKELTKSEKMKKIENNIVKICKSFSSNELLAKYKDELLKEYKRAFGVQFKLLSLNIDDVKYNDNKLKQRFADDIDKFDQSLSQRLNKNHIILGYKIVQEIQREANKKENLNKTIVISVPSVIDKYAKNNAKAEIVTQQTIVEDMVVNDIHEEIKKESSIKNKLLLFGAFALWNLSDIVAVWVTILDSKACESCIEMNGRIFELDKINIRPPLHTNCRCKIILIERSKIKAFE